MDAVSCKDWLGEKMLDKVMQKTREMVLRTKTRRATTEEILDFS